MKKIVIFIVLISLFSCIKKNDYWITEKRAGLIKLGDQELSVEKKLSEFEIKTYNSGSLPGFIKFKTISKNGKELMQLKFNGGILDGIKIFDKRYVIASHGVKIGDTAQEIINKGLYISFIHFGDREGLRCELSEINMKKQIKRLPSLQLFFDRKVYQRGTMRDIGKNAILQFFLIGNNFDIKEDTLTDIERKNLSIQKQGELTEGLYVNGYYGFSMNVPSDWTFIKNYGSEDDFISLFYLKNDNNTTVLSLMIQERTIARDGSQFLDRLGFQGKIEQISNYTDGKLFRKLVISKDDIQHEVYYSIVINSNSIMLKGEWLNCNELNEIDEIIKTIKGITKPNK